MIDKTEDDGPEVTEEEPAPEESEQETTDEAPEEAPEPEEPEAEVVELDPTAQLKEDLNAAQVRLRTVSKAYTDLQKEMKDFRARMEDRARFQSEQQAFGQVKAFFDPVMNLRRSLENPGSDVEALVSGLQIVQRQFDQALTGLGLEAIPGVGATFDPNIHEALAITPVTDEEQDGKVLMVHAGGFQVKGKTVQPAQVVVGKFTPPEETAEA